jgi:hypothetical protein
MKLSGHMVKRLMRRHRVTMREIKTRHQITLKRIREVRAKGVEGFLAAEWLFIITGKWPEAARAAQP